MKKLILFVGFLLSVSLQAQIVTIEPATANAEQEIKVIFDATQGNAGLVGATKVYMHAGVVTDAPTGTDWQNVVGDWGEDNGVGEMTKVAGEANKWEITLSPTARDYFSVPDGTNIFRLAMVFRNADGSTKGEGTPGAIAGGLVTSNGDIYIDLAIDNYINVTSPTAENLFVDNGESISIMGVASSDVTTMAISIDEGSGFVERTSVSSGTTIQFNFTPSQSFDGRLRIAGTINGEAVEVIKRMNVVIVSETTEAALPDGIKKGINYHDDLTKVTLVLEAPGKDFVFAVGDFTNWEIDSEYLMNVTPDGELFWIEVDGLTPNQEYVFQYWVEGEIRIGDPYADKVADPWNDPFIPESVNNEVPDFNRVDYAIATTFQTGQEAFQWAASENDWQRPAKEDLMIYELLVRDFIGSRSYKDLIDSLDYIQNLGVNAIELMPIMEFEGNESWGYNPMYFFAPDKFYGTKNDLKAFIQACHQRGIAVILDMVLNHAFGLNPMVRMYWDAANNKPSADSPWFNPDATHPFNVGFDFNHESTYTQAFADSVNAYWMDEYHFDGYRFDLSKGFTQTNNPNDVNAWSAFDQSRIDILTRMANKLWEVDNEAYVILEHFSAGSEETALADAGMVLWRNVGHAYYTAMSGSPNETFSGATVNSHVSYMESHDEQRQMWETFQEGRALGAYNTKDTTIALERLKMNAAFLYMLPGPKMLWQFGELGYDIDINFNGRVGNKPLVWGDQGNGYYDDPLRGYVYDAFAAVLGLKNQVLDQDNVSYSYDFTGETRSITIDSDDLDVVIIGNYGLEAGDISFDFTETGDWFDYFSGETLNVSQVTTAEELAPGFFKIYTSNDLSDGFPNVVEAYQNPVSITPPIFGPDDQITLTFDASKANPDGTDGLVGADKVYFHAGVVLDDVNGTTLSNVVGNLTDDGIGLMTKVDGQDDIWEITFVPGQYFSLDAEDEAVRLGMYFRDADNVNLGKGFRAEDIYVNMEIPGEIVEVAPESFDQNTEITLTFDARKGNRGLAGESKVYVHTGVVKESATGTNWSNVVGNWGQDDGVGQMTQSSTNPDIWTLTFTPTDYYGLGGSVAYRLSMVFRNADGSKKGEGTPGEYDFGTVTSNGDIYFDIPNIITSLAEELPDFGYYPNPSNGIINFSGTIPGRVKALAVYDINGNLATQRQVTNNQLEPLDISRLTSGVYILRIVTDQARYSMKVLVR